MSSAASSASRDLETGGWRREEKHREMMAWIPLWDWLPGTMLPSTEREGA